VRLLLLALAAVLLLAAPAAAAEQRRATTSEGVRMTLDGRALTIDVPRQTARGARLRVECGRSIRRVGRGDRGTAVGAARARPGRRQRIRLSRTVRDAEWCAFTTARRGAPERSLPYGAARLLPEREPRRAPVVPGPGVRQGETRSDDRVGGDEVEGEDGDATFALAGRTLTVRLRERFALVTLACNLATPERAEFLSTRVVAVAAGQRTVTAVLDGDPTRANHCLIEDDFEGGDIAVAGLTP
jgi:hypothetical protein